ncbi:hypothetical protein KIK04_15125 [Paenibacillus sp. 481]|nr:hypothetical protein KIK04_15125 [Paenibacillus sp. 481]
MPYVQLDKEYKHVGYFPSRYVHVVNVTCETVDFDYQEKERVDQLVIGSEEPITEAELRDIAREKLMEEHQDFHFYREVTVSELEMVRAFDLTLT